MKLDAVSQFKVLVVGDAIYDRYRFCDPQGRATKEAVISVVVNKEEEYQGGVWASARHILDLCKTVDVWHGDEATINTKYIGRYNQKLFSVHEKRVCSATKPLPIADYDVVIVFDYGHGFLTLDLREKLMQEAKFLAVNAQTNSSNYGFNRINEKWRRADFVVIDEPEARLAAHEAEAPIEDVISKLFYNNIIVTMGAIGAIGYSGGEFYRGQAMNRRPVDLLGAGDAVLAVTAPFAAAGFPMRDLLYLGNAAGAIKVGILGHQSYITKSQLEGYL